MKSLCPAVYFLLFHLKRLVPWCIITCCDALPPCSLCPPPNLSSEAPGYWLMVAGVETDTAEPALPSLQLCLYPGSDNTLPLLLQLSHFIPTLTVWSIRGSEVILSWRNRSIQSCQQSVTCPSEKLNICKTVTNKKHLRLDYDNTCVRLLFVFTEKS